MTVENRKAAMLALLQCNKLHLPAPRLTNKRILIWLSCVTLCLVILTLSGLEKKSGLRFHAHLHINLIVLMIPHCWLWLNVYEK